MDPNTVHCYVSFLHGSQFIHNWFTFHGSQFIRFTIAPYMDQRQHSIAMRLLTIAHSAEMASKEPIAKIPPHERSLASYFLPQGCHTIDVLGTIYWRYFTELDHKIRIGGSTFSKFLSARFQLIYVP